MAKHGRRVALLLISLLFTAAHAGDKLYKPDLPPEYYEASADMRNAIIFTGVVGVPGALLAIGGLFDYVYGGSPKNLLIGLAVTGVGVGAGVPMIVSASREKKKIRRQWLLDQKTSDADELRYGLSLVGRDPAFSIEFRFD